MINSSNRDYLNPVVGDAVVVLDVLETVVLGVQIILARQFHLVEYY
jgi:hypothetical protein